MEGGSSGTVQRGRGFWARPLGLTGSVAQEQDLLAGADSDATSGERSEEVEEGRVFGRGCGLEGATRRLAFTVCKVAFAVRKVAFAVRRLAHGVCWLADDVCWVADGVCWVADGVRWVADDVCWLADSVGCPADGLRKDAGAAFGWVAGGGWACKGVEMGMPSGENAPRWEDG